MATEEDGTEAGGQDVGDGDFDNDPEDETPVDAPEPERAAKDDDKPAVPRKVRRVHHMRAAAEAKAAAERERDEYRRRLEETEVRTRELQARIEERERQTTTQSTKAQTQEKISAIRKKAQYALAASAQAPQGSELAQRYWDEYQNLQDEAADLRNEMMDNERWQKRQGEIQQQMPNQEMLQERQYISAKYPWVETSAEGRGLADARFAALVRNGRPATRQTMEEALTYAAKTLRLGGQSAPSEASRQRYTGFAQRDGEADDGASSGPMSAEEVENNLAYKRMALGAYPQLEPKQAFAKWAREIGSKAKRADA